MRTALAELKSRNVELPEDIDEQIGAKIKIKEDANYGGLSAWNKNVVKDTDAPEYYSQKAIYAFSLFFQ